MSTKKPKMMKRCPECGGTIRSIAKAGRLTTYKNASALEVPADLAIPTCVGCGSEWMDEATAKAIDRAMEPVYLNRLREMVAHSIETLSGVVTQGELERKLGMAQGYLSKLKKGRRNPSPEIALQLAMIARHPERRLREIDEIWRHPA